MGLSSEFSCESGSFSCHLNSHRFFSVRGFEALFSCTGTLGCAVCFAPQLFLPVYLDADVGPPLCQLPPCCESSPPWLPISIPPTGLDGCFFNSLIVRLPYSSIFCHFWLFFIFKFVIVVLLIVGGGKVYLPMPLSWPEVIFKSFTHFEFISVLWCRLVV